MNYQENTAKHYGVKAMYTIEKQKVLGIIKPKQSISTIFDLLDNTEDDEEIISYLKQRGFDNEDIANAFKGIDEHLSAFNMM